MKMQNLSKFSNTCLMQEQSSTKYEKQTLQNCLCSSTKLYPGNDIKNIIKEARNCSDSLMTLLRDHISTQTYKQGWAMGSCIAG